MNNIQGKASKFSNDKRRNWQLSAAFSEINSKSIFTRNYKNIKYGYVPIYYDSIEFGILNDS